MSYYVVYHSISPLCFSIFCQGYRTFSCYHILMLLPCSRKGGYIASVCQSDWLSKKYFLYKTNVCHMYITPILLNKMTLCSKQYTSDELLRTTHDFLFLSNFQNVKISMKLETVIGENYNNIASNWGWLKLFIQILSPVFIASYYFFLWIKSIGNVSKRQ